MRIHQLFLFSLAFALRANAAGHVAEEDFELRQLTDDNFKASTAQGLWLVEHFSPKCGHCRAFMPTWTQLAQEKQHLERLSGFHMAQVNCLAQGDLCNSNGIKFYPQLMLYANGKLVEPNYSGDRSHADLSRWIDTHSHSYADEHLLKPLLNGRASGEGEAEAVFNAGRPNPDGKVLEVDEDALEALKSRGPVLTEYFAPWCGHCKKLRPTYEKVAEALKGKVNIAAVDCDAHKAFCRREGVMGYPTIRLLDKEKKTDYNGARSLDAMRDFALKSAEKPTIQPLRLEDFDDALKNDDAFFLYLQNFDTEIADLERVKATLEPVLGEVPVYTSADPLFYANLSISQPPTSALLAFSNHHARPVGSVSFPAEQRTLDRFVTVHRFPTLTHLTSSNYNSIMKSDSRAVVVLAALHKGDEGEKEKEQLMSVARAWKRGGRGFQQPVWFVWVEGEKWGGWLKQSYGIRQKELPAVVIVDPPMAEYYDTTIEGKKVSFEGAAIFSVLEGFYQHFLVPKRVETALEWGSRSATMTLINLSNLGADHPLIALLTVVGGVAVFVFLLQRCMKRDTKEGREAPRLD